MEPKDISRIKQIATQILALIAVAAITYALIYIYRINLPLFFISLTCVLIFIIYMVFIEPNIILFSAKNIIIKNLPEHFKNKKIVHISDIHFGMLFGKKSVAYLVEKINKIEPDFIFITGDFLSVNNKEKINVLADEIIKLKAKYGVFAVFGNHDHYGDAAHLKKKLSEGGINFLVNQAKQVSSNNDKIWVIGIDDPYHEFDDLKMALKDVPHDAVKILLAHSPEIIPEAVEEKIDFLLMGHTHGGQARLPGYKQMLYLSKSLKKYMGGFYKINKTQFYVNRGIGRVTLPIRFLSPPEAAIFVMR